MNMPPGTMPQPPIRYTQEQMSQPSHSADKMVNFLIGTKKKKKFGEVLLNIRKSLLPESVSN